MLSAQRPIEARAPGRRHDLRLSVLGLMRPGAKNAEINEMKEKLFIWSFVQLVINWFAERPSKSQRM